MDLNIKGKNIRRYGKILADHQDEIRNQRYTIAKYNGKWWEVEMQDGEVESITKHKVKTKQLDYFIKQFKIG